MINAGEDYYKVLQVHFMAEPEIIKSAYLRLSKKYHPDVNPSETAEARMKAINRAFEVLSDPVSRKQYLVRWMENYSLLNGARQASKPIHPLDFSVEPGKRVLLTYLSHISKGAYGAAFELLSDHDKRNIPLTDFIKWQTLVAEVFELVHYECELQEIYTNVLLKGSFFDTVVELKVKVRENNHLMGRHEEDEFVKCVVLENESWRVFLGYTELGTVIRRFDTLANLKKTRPVHRITLKKYPALNSVSGALKRKEFQEKASCEQMRFNRYGNRFSMIYCNFDLSDIGAEDREEVIREAGVIIASKIRELDVCCRWKENTFAVLLPETDQSSARKTASKIKRAIEEGMDSFPITFVINEQRYGKLQDLFNRMQARS